MGQALRFAGTRTANVDLLRSMALRLYDQFALGDHTAVEKVNRALGIGRMRRRVGDHDDGRAFSIQRGQHVHDVPAVLGIQVAGGLIGENHLWVGDDGPGHGDALLLPAGELPGPMPGAVIESDQFQDLAHTGAPAAFRHVEVQQRHLHVFSDAQLINEIEALEDETDIALAQVGKARFRIARHIFVHEVVVAAAGTVDHADNAEKRGLAAAGRPHHREKLPGFHRHGDIVERPGFYGVGAVDLTEVREFQHGDTLSGLSVEHEPVHIGEGFIG